MFTFLKRFKNPKVSGWDQSIQKQQDPRLEELTSWHRGGWLFWREKRLNLGALRWWGKERLALTLEKRQEI